MISMMCGKWFTRGVACMALLFAAGNVSAASAVQAEDVAPKPEKSERGSGLDALEQRFLSPPDSARPKTWWHWMNNCISREGITADLEAMKKAGLGGAFIFHVGMLQIGSSVKFGSEEWWKLMRFAAEEAERLGLELGFNNGPGWSASGGPWITPEKSMQKVVWSEQSFSGPGKFEGLLPEGKKNKDYYRDIAVLAIPDQTHVAASAIHDLTTRMDSAGKLTWDAPAGKWKILRFGHTSTGKGPGPAPSGGGGLECDKLDRQGVDAHYDNYIAKVFENAGPSGKKSLQRVLIDSYEAGVQDWSISFRSEFKKRRGYDPVPWLVTATKRTVQDEALTARFQYDWKRTLAELFADNYFGYMAERVHATPGLKLAIEPYQGSFDMATCGTKADEVLGEFWVKPPTWGWKTLKTAASSAHVAGLRIVGAESYTCGPKWLMDPYALKAMGDRAFSLGVNQLILHTTAHQPWTNVTPGMTMSNVGTQFGRAVTWWGMAPAWTAYLTRCQDLLQQGAFVGDICYLSAGGSPEVAENVPGYNWDLCSEELFLKSMTVVDGRLTLPSGMRYRVLVLPSRTWMTPVVARKIRDLVKAGASVVGPKPLASPSLQDYPACDTDVKQIAGELWEGGNVISEKPVAQVLADMKVQPDFQTGATNMVWIHRRIETADVYFVSNQADTGRVVECTFRVAGMQPELWDAATGETHEARTFTSEGGLTKLPVKFDPRGSVFVVFRKPAAGAKGENNWSEFTPVQDVTGAWQVRFDPRWGGPGQVTFDQLTDWTKRAEAGIRYYSGTAVYTKEFDLAKALGNARLFLDLGTVKNLAEVRVNGQSVGIAWKQPFRVEVTKAVKQGANTLEVRVVNLWPNRFIGDEQEPDDCVRDKYGALKEIPSWLTEGKPRPSAGRYTFLVYKPYNKTERLLESGLLGPVRIVCEAGH